MATRNFDVSTRQNLRKLDFEKAIAPAEAPGGFTAQTANGTARYEGTGWNRDYQWGTRPQVAPFGPWQPGNSNRTCE